MATQNAINNLTDDFELNGNLDLLNTFSSTTGVITKESDRWIHNFQHPTGGTAVPAGKNLFIGKDSGNFTTGSTATAAGEGSSLIGIGNSVLKNNTTGGGCIGIGATALQGNTDGFRNVGIGSGSLNKNTSGENNTAVGDRSLFDNKLGSENIAIGSFGIWNNIDGEGNVGVGYQCLRNHTDSNYNTALGHETFMSLTSGDDNTSVGSSAGKNYDGGSLNTADQCVFVGSQSRALANSTTNEISIGYLAIGAGSNSVVLGNDSITKTHLKGDILAKGTSRYMNFNTTEGSTGYGFRDNAGTMEFKNNAGSWAIFGSGSGTVTSVSAGNGLDFTTITTSGSVTLGTPTTLTSATTNAVTTTSHAHDITTGILDTNILRVDQADATNGEYAKFTANGLESKSFAEVKTDLSLNNVENTALSTWAGSSNVTTVGTISSGTWNGSDIDVANGGSGRSSHTAYSVICGGTTTTADQQSVSGVGTSTQILTSNGASALPTWQDPSSLPPSYGGMNEGFRGNVSVSGIPTFDPWITASAGEVAGGDLVTFVSDDTNGDKLVIGSDGAGIYRVTMTCNVQFDGSGGKILFVNLYKNNGALGNVYQCRVSHKDNSDYDVLTTNELIELAANDYISIKITASASDTWDFWKLNLILERIAPTPT